MVQARGQGVRSSLVAWVGWCAVVCCVVLMALIASAAHAQEAGDANRATCAEYPGTEASPGFRAGLPDCRAYEMVTPPFQNGSEARWIQYRPPLMSADGEHILALNIGGFAGTENDEQEETQTGAIYEFSRAPGGWTTEALAPSARKASRALIVTASADLSSSLWLLPLGVTEGEEIVTPPSYAYGIRQGSGAAAHFVPVGPTASPTAPERPNELLFSGASNDLQHVVFSVIPEETAMLWPGDTTNPETRSLYEYIGTGGREPRLVGVRNQGPLNGSVHVNESAQLISKCGTRLGSPTSSYNAMSTDGETLFFTASPCEEGEEGPTVAELYARRRGSETVAISEPTVGPTGDCEACDESGELANGTFEGASTDGSKVFFLSEQDGLLPGAEGPNLYEFDFAAPAHHKLTRIGSGVAAPKVLGVARISEDGSHVYFVAEGVLTGPNGEGKEPTEGSPNLYDYEPATGTTTFVATLAAEDEADWGGDQRPVQASTDGNWLTFTSRAALTSDDRSSVGQVFEYEAASGKLMRASVGQRGSYFCAETEAVEDGFACNGNTTVEEDAPLLFSPLYNAGSRPPTAGLSISNDGAVFFSSLAALTPEAVHGGKSIEGPIDRENVYEYRAANVYLISAPTEPAPVATLQRHFLGADQSGRDAFFFTTAALTPDDQDTQSSWYDARVGGGFPAGATPPTACAGDACQGSLSLPPPGLSTGSATVEGNGNAVPAQPVVKPPASKPPVSRAVMLSRALKACRAKRNKQARKRCEATAHKRYGPIKARKPSPRKKAKK